MASTFRSSLRILAGMALASFTAYIVRMPSFTAVCSTVARFVIELPRYLVDFAATVVTSALRMFGPTGVFALAMQRISNLVHAMFKSWGRGSAGAGHYRAPGSWVSCAST